MIRAGIVGISGYSGYKLLEILLKHKNVRVTQVAANTTHGPVAEIWPQFSGKTALVCEKVDVANLKENCDLIFLAVPHATSIQITPELMKAGLKVIDLSGDYRLKSADLYKQWYSAEHTDPENLKLAVYGLPELNREKIKNAKLVANPGCYPTAATLSLAPIISTAFANVTSIVVDAKSGVTGAGKKASVDLLFSEVNENFKAYKILAHQHAPEIEQNLSGLAGQPVKINFVAHLLPINQGIFETIYVHLKDKIELEKTHDLYKKFYKTESFVRILPLGKYPEIKHVANSNFCDIALTINADRNLLVITSAIDNLVKGAAGQAVQNMNIIFGFSETEALL